MTKSRLDRTPNSDVREMEEIDLLELFRAILKYIKLIIVLCIVFGAGGFFETKFLITPTYTARTSIYLTPQINDTGSLDYNSQMANSKLVTNVVNLMTQTNIMSEVAKDVGLKMARRYPNIYLEMSGMPMHTKIKEAYDTVGHDRILFGTDAPFHHPTVEMQKVLMSGVDEKGIEDIFYNNAKKFFDV